ncbi:MAG: tRNA (adenosine(37)-N6)-threonylcarbamoyltransferase complex ATPase subunit type 1 TsaE [Candidatus Binatia bacterium]
MTPEETEALGEAIGRAATGGELLGLSGELGAGKTCLVRGLARGLGADPELVHSPTFTIATEYRGGRLPLTHVDLYRLETPVADELFLRDVLFGAGVVAVEWFERLLPAAGAEYLLVTLHHARGDRRTIRLEAHGPRHERLLAALEAG